MFWRIVSGVMLVVLAISTMELAFRIQPVEADGTTQNHAHPHRTLLPPTLGSNLLSSIPDPSYNEQLGLTFTQNFSSMAYNVTAVPQTDTNGYGPAYLLNGLSDSGYWYQVGLSYNWPSAAGFSLIYCVFDANGSVVLPSNGGGGISPFSGPVNPGDTVLLNLDFSGGNVFMYAKDWNTAAFAHQTYSDEGATYFMGQPSSSGNPNNFFSGLMTEWYHANPYYGKEEEVTYSNYTSALTSAWMWIDESNPYTMETLFYSIEFVNYANPNQFQSLSSNGTTESSNAYEFVTGSSGPIYIGADGSIDPCAPISTVDNVTYTFTGDIYDSIVIERDNIALDGDGHTLQGVEYGAGIDLSGRTNVTVEKMQIKAFDYGISLKLASNNTVSENNVTNNGVGISLNLSSDNIISGNKVVNNGLGFVLESSSNNSISENSVTANNWGILLNSSSNNDSIFGNTVAANNGCGIFLVSGLGNGIYHNNFVNNSQQVRCDLGMNVWDDGYPLGGNHWSDYGGVDIKSGPHQDQPGSDGIGDAGYSIENNNTDHYPLMQPWNPHNIAVVNVVAAKTVVGRGFSGNVAVLVANRGDYVETFNVTVYANATAMDTQLLRNLNASQTTLTFTLNTTGLAYGVCTIKAVAHIVPGEANETDNACLGGSLVVTIPGDLNGDFAVRLSDLTLLAQAYGSKPGDPKWVPNADVDNNQLVGLGDLNIMAQHYGQHYP